MGGSSNSKNGVTPPKDMNFSDPKELATIKPSVTPGETVAILGISRQRVHELMDEGKLEVIQFLGARRVLVSSVIQRLKKFGKGPRNNRKVL